MKIWIDTGATQRAQTLFGVPPIERLRRSAAKLVAGTPVVLSGPDATEQTWAGATIEADATKLGARLRKALSQGPLVALDGANVIDPRLIAFLVRHDGSCAASRGEGDQRAVALRLAPD